MSVHEERLTGRNQKNLRRMKFTCLICKEKLRMTRDLVKSNNKKIKKALDHINRFLAEREENKSELPIFLADITDIKEILES